MRDQNVKRCLFVDRRAIDGIAARWITAIGPVERAIFEIKLEIYRFRQAVEEYFDIGTVCRGLAPRDLHARTKDSAAPSLVRSLLGPVDLLALRVDGDPNAPFGLVAPIRVVAAHLDERFDLRAIEIRAHDTHALAVAPVELAIFLIEMKLLRRERAAFGNDDGAIPSIEVSALDRAVVATGDAHVGPVDMTGFGI